MAKNIIMLSQSLCQCILKTTKQQYVSVILIALLRLYTCLKSLSGMYPLSMTVTLLNTLL